MRTQAASVAIEAMPRQFALAFLVYRDADVSLYDILCLTAAHQSLAGIVVGIADLTYAILSFI